MRRRSSPSLSTKANVPIDYKKRPYQQTAWDALKHGAKRAALVWHRRAGKDLFLLNWTVVCAFERPGVYWHVFPTARQGRKIVWDGVTGEGRTFLSYWPKACLVARNDAEMKLKFDNGSVWQVVGSENYEEALIGGNPVGIVLSEYALQNPSCWNYLRPILAENGGWAAFAFTPRGRNHGHALYEMARGNPEWFAEKLGVRDTGAISLEAIAAERAAGMPDELIEQEFDCSFDAAIVGAYYGREMKAALDEGRIGRVPYDPTLPVETWWDLGIDDATSIWFVQVAAREIRLIDFYEASGRGLDHYAKMLRERPYAYARHVLPHDANARELGTGRSRIETLRSLLGVAAFDGEGAARLIRIAPRLSVADGVNAVRTLLPRCWFDELKCGKGIESLRQYQREWDDERKVYADKPLHDWTSHAADAFRYGAIVMKKPRQSGMAAPDRADDGAWNPLDGVPRLRSHGPAQEERGWDPLD